jgi:asparagine N-glycosylation enzyme membrane subunit Stt3
LAWAAYFAGWVVDYWLKRESATAEVGKKLLFVGGLSLAASCITPDGWSNWQAMMGNSSLYILNQTVETMSPNFQLPGMIPFLILLILAVLLPIFDRFRLSTCHMFLLAGFAILSLLMARNIPLFAICAAPILAVSARGTLIQLPAWMRIELRLGEIEGSLRGYVWLVVGPLAAIFLFSYYHLQTQSTLNKFDEQVFPVQAVNWLVAHPQAGNMFNEFNWGGYLLHRLWPDQLVFIDSQTDFYGEALARDYNQIINAQNDWETKLKQYDIDWVIVAGDAPLVHVLEAEHQWQVLYQDDTSVILRK